MKHSRLRKAFTLVELIVVIAIIAILTTVGIIGYTTYIDQANLAADRTEVDDINRALSTDKQRLDFEAPKTIMQVRELLDVYSSGGSFRGSPRSIKLGYHYWFDIENLELHLAPNTDEIDVNAQPVSTKLLDNYAKTNWSLIPEGFSFDSNNNKPFIFIDKDNSDIANVVQSFYDVQNLTTYQHMINGIDFIGNDQWKTNLTKIFEETVFITNEGNFAQSSAPKNAIFQENITIITNRKIDKDGQSSQISEENVLVDLQGLNIVIPNTVETILPNSIIINDGTVIIDRSNKSEDNKHDGLNPYFTNSNLIIIYSDEEEEYIINANGHLQSDTKEIILTTSNEYLVQSFNPVFNENDAAILNVALDSLDLNADIHFSIKIKDIKNSLSTSIVTSNVFIYESSDDQIATIDSQGNIKVLTGGQVTFTITPKEGLNDTVKDTVTLNVGSITYFSFEADDGTLITPNNNLTINREYDADLNENSIIISLDGIVTSLAGVNYNPSLNAKYEGAAEVTIQIDANEIKLIYSSVGLGIVSMWFNEYPNLVIDFDLFIDEKVDETIRFTFSETSSFLYRVGNGNNIVLKNLFEIVSSKVDSTTIVILNEFNDELANNASSENVYYTINGDNYQFHGTGIIRMKVISRYTNALGTREKIDILNFEVVDGNNITTLSGLGGMSNGVNGVLINDLIVSAYSGYNIKNAILYGNGFKIDATSAQPIGGVSGILTLTNGTLDNIQLYTRHFITADWSTGTYSNYGVRISGNSKLVNSYIEGSKAPVQITGAEALIENTTIVGGSYSNVYIETTSNVTFKDLTTIQRVEEAIGIESGAQPKGVIGAGIVIGTSTTNVTIEGYLKQFNWITKDMIDLYAPDLFKSTMSSMFSSGDLAKYRHQIDGVDRVNLGIIFLEQANNNFTDNRSPSLKGQVSYSLQSITVTHPSYPLMSAAGTIIGIDKSGTINNDLAKEYNYYPPVYQSTKTILSQPKLSINDKYSSNYISSNNTFNFEITPSDVIELDINEMVSIYKYGTQLPINLANTKLEYHYADAGNHVISFTVIDTLIYDVRGNITYNQIEYQFSFEIVLTKGNIPNAQIILPETLEAIRFSQSSSYHVAINVWNGLEIWDYNEAGQLVKVLDGSDSSINKNNPADYGVTVEVLGWSSAQPTTFTTKYTKDNVFWLRSDTLSRGTPILKVTYSYTGVNGITVYSTTFDIDVGSLTNGSGGDK